MQNNFIFNEIMFSYMIIIGPFRGCYVRKKDEQPFLGYGVHDCLNKPVLPEGDWEGLYL
jgi:hypothetical protein